MPNRPEQDTVQTPPRLAVMICEELPRPGENGPGSYNLTILRALAALGYHLHIVVTGLNVGGRASPAQIDCTLQFLHARRVGPWLVPTSLGAAARFIKKVLKAGPRKAGANGSKVAWIGRFLSDAETRAIAGKLPQGRIDAVFIDTIFRSAALQSVVAGTKALVAHDVFYQRSASFRANGFTPKPAVDAKLEGQKLQSFDAIIAINDRDHSELAELAPSSRVCTILPVVGDAGACTSAKSDARRDPHKMFYLGSRAYHNVDGIRWFLSHVWPLVQNHIPDASIEIVGGVCAEVPPGLNNVTLHGRVEQLDEIADRCSFAVNPVLMGSGIKIKMVEYFCLGLGCITTANGAAGFPEEGSLPYTVADGVEAFAQTIVAMMQNPAEPKALRDATQAYTRHFSHEAAVAKMHALLQQAQLH